MKTAPVYIPRPYSINRRHHVFPLPGKVYSSGGVRDSACVKKCRFEYFDAHIDCEAIKVPLVTVLPLSDGAGAEITSALISGTNLAAFKSAYFVTIAVNSNCKIEGNRIEQIVMTLQ